MELVKIFCRGVTDTPEKLEAEVNTWLAQHKGITVTQRLLSTTSGRNILESDYVNVTVVIFYTEAA